MQASHWCSSSYLIKYSMTKLTKFLRANIGFLIVLGLIVLLGVSPKAKSLVLRGLIRTGLYEPDVSHLKPKEVPASLVSERRFVAPSIMFEGTDGKSINLADLRGKVVFLNFWATWCPPCLAEMPSVNALYSKVKDNENIVFILADADRA